MNLKYSAERETAAKRLAPQVHMYVHNSQALYGGWSLT